MDLIKRILFPKYGNDAIMSRVLNNMDAVGRDERLFAEAA